MRTNNLPIFHIACATVIPGNPKELRDRASKRDPSEYLSLRIQSRNSGVSFRPHSLVGSAVLCGPFASGSERSADYCEPYYSTRPAVCHASVTWHPNLQTH